MSLPGIPTSACVFVGWLISSFCFIATNMYPLLQVYKSLTSLSNLVNIHGIGVDKVRHTN